MRVSFICLGFYVGMEILSSEACSASSNYIKDHLTSNINLPEVIDTESQSISLSSSPVTINGKMPEGTHIIPDAVPSQKRLLSLSASKELHLSNLVVQYFSAPSTGSGTRLGGAIYASSKLTLAANTGPVLFRMNSADDSNISGQGQGGAIYAKDLDITASSTAPITFADNSAIGKAAGSGQGGAIYAIDSLSLADVTFLRNSAKYVGSGAAPDSVKGGAVYVGRGIFRYTITSATANILSPIAISQPVLGDNDIACYDRVSSFVKDGPGELVLNTNNSGWLGNTNITAGTFTVGDTSTNARAIWGPSAGSRTFTVDGADSSHKATLRGYGTINADSLTFGANSIWNLCLGGLLNVDTLKLTQSMNVYLSGILPNPFSSGSGYNSEAKGYAVANYRNLIGSTDSLNRQLAAYNLMLTASDGKIILTQSPSGLYLGIPSAQNILVNFRVPGFFNGRAITRNGEGIVVWCGKPGTKTPNFFEGNSDNGIPTTSIVLNNHKIKAISTSNTSVSDETVTNATTPCSWIGSVALPISGLPYAWQLWRHTYGNAPTYPTTSEARGNNWVAQGLLNITGTDLLSVTYQITPYEGAVLQ